jgi:hypothetical protein
MALSIRWTANNPESRKFAGYPLNWFGRMRTIVPVNVMLDFPES